MKRNLLAAVLVATTLALAGCASPASNELEPSTVKTEEAKSVDALNAHSAIDTAIGAPVVLKFPGTEKTAVEFTVTRIDRDVKCTEQFAIPPQQGEFIGLAIEITTATDYMSISGNEPMRFFRNDFFGATSAESDLEEAGSGTGCISGELPFDIPAGTTTIGLLMLDLSPATTSIFWEPSTFVIHVPSREWPIP